MSNLVVQRDEGSNESVTQCVTITEPTQFIFTGQPSATIKFNRITVATLNAAKRTHKVFVAGEYCVTVNQACNTCTEAKVESDTILGTGGGGSGGGNDTERSEVGCTADVDGNIDGKIYLTTIFNDAGVPIGDELVRVGFDGTITRPYTGDIVACSVASDPYFEDLVNIIGGTENEYCVSVITTLTADGLTYIRTDTGEQIDTDTLTIEPVTDLNQCCEDYVPPPAPPVAVDNFYLDGDIEDPQNILLNDMATPPAVLDPTTIKFNTTGSVGLVSISSDGKFASFGDSGTGNATIDPITGIVTLSNFSPSLSFDVSVGYTVFDDYGSESNSAVIRIYNRPGG